MEFYLNSFNDVHSTRTLIPVDVIRPSEYDGFSLEEEESFRLFGCELIQEGGIMLKLPQITMVTAMELFHRFFFRQSFIKVDMKHTVAACLFLATKLEETPKKIRDVISVFDYLLKIKEGVEQPIPVLDLNSDEFSHFRQELITAERAILKEVGFVLAHFQTKPYKYLYYYLKVMKLNKAFAQKAWNYVNDAYRSAVCVSYPAHVLAAAGIYLASRTLDYPLPDVDWWVAFDCNIDQIQDVAVEIVSLYKQKKVTMRYILDVLAKHMPEPEPEPVPKTPPSESTPPAVSNSKSAAAEPMKDTIASTVENGSKADGENSKSEGKKDHGHRKHRSRSGHRSGKRHSARGRSHNRSESEDKDSSESSSPESEASRSRSRHRGRKERGSRKHRGREDKSRTEAEDRYGKDVDMHYSDRPKRMKQDGHDEHSQTSRRRAGGRKRS